ncbi:MAG: WYL domain-containing protein [Acidobacteria bacterium]|nr:WYL domain-containing protein [Acidobacteriota bacterium]
MSRRGDLTERLVRIPLLLAEGPQSQRQLARELEVDAVTIRRAINQLSRFYYITEERRNRETVYRFGDGYKYRPPNFTPTELATLLLAQQSIASTGLTSFGTPFARSGQTLLEKVRAALPLELRSYLDLLANIFGSAAVPAKNYAPHAGTIDRLTKAAVTCRRIKLHYHTLRSGQLNERLFDPYSVYFDPDGATLKVIGFDHLSSEIRTFSIDHIQNLIETEETFTRPSEFDLRAYLTKYCFNGIHGNPILVRLRAYGVTARIFSERQFHPSQRLIAHNPESAGVEEQATIEMTVAQGRGLERFILSWMPYVEVLSPPELRTSIAAVLRQAAIRQSGDHTEEI